MNGEYADDWKRQWSLKTLQCNKLSNTFHLHATMCDMSLIPTVHKFNAILQAMEYRNKLWGYNIMRFKGLISWTHKQITWSNEPPPPSLFIFLPRFPFRSRLWQRPLAALVWWNLKVFFWDWDYLLGIRWILFCLEIRQWPIESLNKQNANVTFLYVATVSAKG